jgi:uncharacterized membrane protein YesL
MAGIFGFFDYNKPGKGIPKDAPPKPRIVVFFEIYLRKFWNLMALNLMFFLFNLPATFIAVMYLAGLFTPTNFSSDISVQFALRIIIGGMMIGIPFITFGPAQAGFTYILRNYAREEHAWVWYDFKTQGLRNFKQSMIISLIDIFVLIIVGLDINLYLQMGNNIMLILSNALVISSFVIFIMMHMYIYPLMVTFKLTVLQIYKNALFFTLMRFFSNLGILILCVLIIVIPLFIKFGIILFTVITMSTVGLIINFHVYPALKKYMMDKVQEIEEVK